MPVAFVTSRDRITIPVEVRRALGLRPHDRVVFTVMPDRTTVLRPKVRSLAGLTGALKPRVRTKVPIKALHIGRA